jgi:uncharacterized protein YbaR (Trm112 family)
MKLARDLQITLICLHCRAEIVGLPDAYVCTAADCRRSYPIVDGIPKFLIDDATILTPEQWQTTVPQNGNGAPAN